MKKMMSLWGLCSLATAMLLTSCVAKKKYTEAQNTITELRQTNADCLQKGDSLNRSLSSLQQANSDLQRRYDSTTTAYTSAQTRWNDYTSFYDKQKTTVTQLHQQLHQQLDEMIGATNITTDNNKVYVTLPEAILFTSGSTSLSSKGKTIINTLATTIAQNPDVEVNVATTAVYEGTGMAMNDNANMVNDANTKVKTDEAETKVKTDDAKMKTEDKTYNNAGNVSVKKKPSNGTYKQKTQYKNTTAKASTKTKHKSETGSRTMRTSYASSKKPTASSSSMAVARASAVVSELRQQGISRTGILVTDPANKTSVSPRKYQVIVSPSMDGYYDMMGKNMGTGMK